MDKNKKLKQIIGTESKTLRVYGIRTDGKEIYLCDYENDFHARNAFEYHNQSWGMSNKQMQVIQIVIKSGNKIVRELP